ncbi:MAG: hypothetical protein HY909_09305 [Deltaproteobacteria bacterium]|nr:hypothetical protein [Deltaproteobacteria bacterium]
MKPYERIPPDVRSLFREVATYQAAPCDGRANTPCVEGAACGCVASGASMASEEEVPGAFALSSALGQALSVGPYGDTGLQGFSTEVLAAIEALPPELVFAALRGVVASYSPRGKESAMPLLEQGSPEPSTTKPYEILPEDRKAGLTSVTQYLGKVA